MVSAPVQSIDGPFVPASADQPLDVGLHQQLQDALGHSTQKVTVASLLQKLIQWQSLLGHRGFSGQCEVEQLHPRPPAAVTTPAPLPDRHVFPPPIPPEITPRPWTLPPKENVIQHRAIIRSPMVRRRLQQPSNSGPAVHSLHRHLERFPQEVHAHEASGSPMAIQRYARRWR